MKAVLQRVKSASIAVDDKPASSINQGLLVAISIEDRDTDEETDSLVGRILTTNIWPREGESQDQRTQTVQDVQGEILCVSHYALSGHREKKKLSIADISSMRQRYEYFFSRLCRAYRPELVKNGVLEAMEIGLRDEGALIGVDYRSEDAVVTIKINTQLPREEKEETPATPSETESSSGEKKSYEFVLPAELLD